MAEYHSWNSLCLKNVAGAALGVFVGLILVPFFSFLGGMGWTIALILAALAVLDFAFGDVLFGFLKASRRKKHQMKEVRERPKYASPILFIVATIIGIAVGLIKLNIQSGAA